MILISGAAGKTGQAIINRLAAQGQKVRGLVRRREQSSLLLKLGAEDTVVGDLVDRAAWEKAVVGVQAIYHICPNMHPQELAIGQHAIRAAQNTAVTRFVYHSVLHPQTEAMPHHWQKLRVEELLLEAGLDFTILQPAAYMQNVLAYREQVEEGVFAIPYGVDTRIGMIDLRDLAEVAVKVLTENGHQGAIYELCGSEVLSQREIAAIWGAQLGLKVRAESVALKIWEQKARSTGLNNYAVHTLAKMFKYYDRFDFWGNSNVLRWLLGRPPTTFADFIKSTYAAP